ncbi:amino acid permease [Lacticaseibacillus pabuli]|uniref:Amino acid permease n=1 Tax=Lacticaseibacillus pabuli TaxID=3025672 RepID=A0ABY7WUY9_9LACO|nr:amino acid permease [Lacticaseibacillus sp. KACC 23028]WDF82869.1 amino acid permease [Lacticaseibacillus sp. KACC 23028]
MQKTDEVKQNSDGTRRELTNRHVSMIALGGTIGTGLFLGASNSIMKTGPSIIIVYAVLGLIFFLMMRAIGELMYADPSQHTFISFISKYLGHQAGHFALWTYWLGVIFVAMAELTAVSKYVQFWFPSWHTWTIQLVVLALLMCVNLIAVRLFGETEFWFAMIKVTAIVVMIIVGLGMVFMNYKTPVGHASFANITRGFTMFPNGWESFVAAFPMVFFSFQGMEFIGITTSETENPRKVLPKVINEILLRILIFYIGAIVVIMAIYPWQSLDPHTSPFVQVFELAGLKAAAAVINFVVLTAAASALNSYMYSAGRHFYQIALDSRAKAFKPFRKIAKSGVPARGVMFSAAMILLGPILNSLPQISDAFAFITSVSSDMYIIVYLMTMLAHRKYRESKQFDPQGFLMPAYKVTSPLVILFFVAVYISLFTNGTGILPAIGGLVWTAGFLGIQYLVKSMHEHGVNSIKIDE